ILLQGRSGGASASSAGSSTVKGPSSSASAGASAGEDLPHPKITDFRGRPRRVGAGSAGIPLAGATNAPTSTPSASASSKTLDHVLTRGGPLRLFRRLGVQLAEHLPRRHRSTSLVRAGPPPPAAVIAARRPCPQLAGPARRASPEVG